jgi:tetratricopeptide (TPR) repeat protein
MHRLLLVPLVAALAVACGSSSRSSGPGDTSARAPLYENLGTFQFPITTSSPDAQRYFDQGMRLSYAFNHAEAIRAFRQAAAIDPQCAMCFWGVAYALGPNINAPITPEAARDAWAAIGQARQASGASEKERAFIEALAKRYTADPNAERAPLDRAYAEAMRGLTKQYPDDLDAATMFAQSLMDTNPWNYWDVNGNPAAFTGDVLAALESVLKRNPNHIGAIHLYIHAVEASPDAKRAEPYADRLAALAPGAGHLVHMPGHIYLRTGRYHDASLANDNAVKADEAYFSGDHVPENMMYEVGYYPHNMHFLVTSASLEGRQADALRAAEQVRQKVPEHMVHDPGMSGMVQHMRLAPLYTKVRFGLWDQVLAEPAPPSDLAFTTAMWHTARGLALVATGRVQEAEAERKPVEAARADRSLQDLMVSSVNRASAIVAIADEVLAAEIAAKRTRAEDAARHFAQAAALEDKLTYMEPPDWPIPVRQLQGAALLELGRARDAEAAFRGDLQKFPDNGWSLSGLDNALERQGKRAEAAAVREQTAASWSRADVQVFAGRVVRSPAKAPAAKTN